MLAANPSCLYIWGASYKSGTLQPFPQLDHLLSELGTTYYHPFIMRGFPGSAVLKTSPNNAGDSGLIPGSGQSPGEGNGNPLQYSCLENPVDRGAWRATVNRVTVGHDWACELFVIKDTTWEKPTGRRRPGQAWGRGGASMPPHRELRHPQKPAVGGFTEASFLGHNWLNHRLLVMKSSSSPSPLPLSQWLGLRALTLSFHPRLVSLTTSPFSPTLRVFSKSLHWHKLRCGWKRLVINKQRYLVLP